jgi:hypothetical protein
VLVDADNEIATGGFVQLNNWSKIEFRIAHYCSCLRSTGV